MEMIKVMREEKIPRVVVHYDHDCAMEPDMDVTSIIHWHSRYSMHSDAVKINPRDYDLHEDDHDAPFELDLKAIERDHELIVSWPLFMYQHGGSALSVGSGFSCSWDSGQVGIVGMTREQWALLTDEPWTGTPKQRERALKAISAQIEVLDHFHNGRVYGFKVYGDDGEVEDSCWGFYGSDVETNGMLDCVEKKYWDMLKEAMEDPQV